VVVVAAVVLALGACGGDDDDSADAIEDAIEDAGNGDVDVDVDEDDGSVDVDVSTDDGTFSSGDDVPDELADLVSDDWEVVGSFSGTGDGGTGAYVTLGASGDVDDVAADAKELAEDAGYEVADEYRMEAGGVATVGFAFSGDDGSGGVVIAEDTTDEHDVVVTVSWGTE
jgi:hypothetical protein